MKLCAFQWYTVGIGAVAVLLTADRKNLRGETMRYIRKKPVVRILCTVLAAIMILPWFRTLPAEAKEVTTVEMKWEAAAPDTVTLTEEYCVNALQLETAYLLEFDCDRLLAGFRETAGLDMKGAVRYSGWENSLIGGHTLGHYLTACAQDYISADTSAEDKAALYEKLVTLIDGLQECQENSKEKPGFLFGAVLLSKENVALQFDNVENGLTNIMTQAWVPWYTIHKILQGLIDVYRFTDYEPAKAVASALGDWIYERTSSWSAGTRNTVLGIEYGGMNDCLYSLYAITGKQEHAEAAHSFDETALFEKVLTDAADVLNNRHANTTIPKFIGALNRYVTLHGTTDASGAVIDASVYLEYAKHFFDMVITHHTYITGGNSEWEHFGRDDVLDSERTSCNCETCNTYNMLKLAGILYSVTGEAKYAEYYETAYINTILSSQNPTTGMTTYFQPMAGGYFKVYGEKFNKFWCCTGSGMENFTKLGSNLYYLKDDTVYTALFISSTLRLSEKGVTLNQESDVLSGGGTVFTVKTDSGEAVQIALAVRIPDWEKQTPAITLNETPVETEEQDGYLILRRSFANGDRVAVEFHMEAEAVGLPDADNVFAFRFGPLVLSACLGEEEMFTTTTGVNVTVPGDTLLETEEVILKETTGSLTDFITDINSYLVKADDSMTFTLTGTETQLTFVPHYTQYKERYGIYWYFTSYDDSLVKDDDAPKFEFDVIDTVQPGYGQYENDILHAMTEAGTVGVTSDSTYRYAKAGGSFTYRMAVDMEQDTFLSVVLRKEDNGKTLKITIGREEAAGSNELSNTTVIYEETLNYSGEEEQYEIYIRLPFEALKNALQTVEYNGQKRYTVQLCFEAADGQESARVCDFIRTGTRKILYETDETLAYFVDCGDHEPSTISDGDRYGKYNSVTEQAYSADPVTGYYWGIVDDMKDQYNGSGISNAVYTANTWAYEYEKTDGTAKTASNRYTKNQLESGVSPRFLDYSFELPNGTYEIEVGFTDPWNCSDQPTVYGNFGKDNQVTIAEKLELKFEDTAKGQVTVTDENLTINVRSDRSAINMTFIKIAILSQEEQSFEEGEMLTLNSSLDETDKEDET